MVKPYVILTSLKVRVAFVKSLDNCTEPITFLFQKVAVQPRPLLTLKTTNNYVKSS